MFGKSERDELWEMYNKLSVLGQPVEDNPFELPTMTIGEYMDDEEFERKVWNVVQDNVAMLLRKHRDYGPRNISQSPGGALNGLRVRMHDKLARINHLLDSGAEPENESLIDSFLDLANYAVIAQLVIRGEWPND
jgi:hypothetical protein